MKSFLVEVQIFIFRPKTMAYSPWFDLWSPKRFWRKRIPSEMSPQEEQNDANFSFIAPSSEEFMSLQTFSNPLL